MRELGAELADHVVAKVAVAGVLAQLLHQLGFVRLGGAEQRTDSADLRVETAPPLARVI